jgi:hypothetical protein
LLESIQRLVQPIDMVRICSIFKTGRLLHIDLFIDEAIQESTLYIHLK